MTQEQKNKIFLEYFRPAESVGKDLYCGDLHITSVGINSAIRCNPLCFEHGLEMEPLSGDFYYGDLEIMEGNLDNEEDENDYYAPVRKLIKGELKQWHLVSFTISDNGNDGEHFINFTALHTDLDSYKASKNLEEWYEQNTCTGMYFDHSNDFTLFSTNEGRVAYLMHSYEENSNFERETSFIEVTEFIDYRKTRTFHRWFHERKAYSNSWHITIWANA